MQQDEQTLLIIGFCMLCVHIGVVYWSAISRLPMEFAPKVERCVVNVISPRHEMPEQEKKMEKNPSEKNKTAAKKTATKKTATRKKRIDKGKKDLLANAKKKLENIQSRSTLNDLAMVESLEVDAVETVDYEKMLAYHLRQMLRLPEFGEVKVKLTLNWKGDVVSAVVIETASMLNSKYVKKTLPSLRFPPFGLHFYGEEEHAFLVTLTNDR
ncbi:MAG: hypothetical protein WB791_05550 [Waddliaceae bacterium]